MKFVRRLYHFLGSVYFALLLISAVAILVIIGTFLESLTQSHGYAARFTYDTPLFSILLWGFFINILFSATRRWPFKWKHIPFLTTHFGLLMILAGVLGKHYFGQQGSMSLLEGAASHEIMDLNTYAVSVEKRGEEKTMRYPIRKTPFGNFLSTIAKAEDGLTLRLADYHPHSKEFLATWIKKSYAVVNGLKPMPLQVVSHDEDFIAATGMMKHPSEEGDVWTLYALKTSDIEKTLARLYMQNARMIVADKFTKNILLDEPLPNIINHSQKIKDRLLTTDLSLDFSSFEGFQHPMLLLNYGSEKFFVHLNGPKALLNLTADNQIASLPITFDIIQSPLIAIIEDDCEDVFLAAIDSHGSVWSKIYRKGHLDALVAYDNGFSGYTVLTELPFKTYDTGRQNREDAIAYQLTSQLRQAISEDKPLAPPLQLMLAASTEAKINFPEAITSFLVHWHSSPDWLYPDTLALPSDLAPLFSKIDWNEVSATTKLACGWVKRVFDQIQPDLITDTDLISVLHRHRWPLLEPLLAEVNKSNENDTPISPHTLLTHQLFAAAEALPHENSLHLLEDSSQLTPEIQASLLSAFLRAYGIHFSSILQLPEETEMEQLIREYLTEKMTNNRNAPTFANDLNNPAMTLETTVMPIQKAVPPRKKLEDNFPKITLFVNKGQQAQAISLTYDRTATGLKWPVLNGEYLLRFQPLFKEIPYRLRLRQARQVNYANSSQPYSFECDLVIRERKNDSFIEKTISMNKVHETWDGYRFYLSSITPSDESAVKRVQIVVNYDPAKYLLTYPGAIILSCGILLLFMIRPYKADKRSKH